MALLEFLLSFTASEVVQWTLITTALALFIRLLWQFIHLRLSMPPGPWGNWIPFVGCLPYLTTYKKGAPHMMFVDYARKHGPIFSMKIGASNNIFIADSRLLREAFKREDLANRGQVPLVDEFIKGHGIVSSNGELWRSQRQFVYGVLRDLGMLRKTSSDKVCFEHNALRAIGIFISEIENLNGQTFDISKLLGFTVFNTLVSTIMSNTFEVYDERVMKEISDNNDSFKIIDEISAATFMPLLLNLPRYKAISKILRQRNQNSFAFYKPIIAEHRQTLDPNEPRDLIDAFLIQMNKDAAEGNENTYFTEFQLNMVLGDLMSAGLETTKTTILWFILILIKYPEIQDKIQLELDTVIGRNREPSLDDRPHLTYLEACILETHRFATVLPMGAPHRAIKDLTLEGYFVPKDSFVFGLHLLFHRDPQSWRNPDNFDPEHFLTSDGTIARPETFMPFSVGRRVCMGQDVANNEIFLICSHLLQKFRLLPPEDGIVPDLDGLHKGVLTMPKPYSMRAVLRY